MTNIKHWIWLAIISTLILLFFKVGQPRNSDDNSISVVFIDSLGKRVSVSSLERVVVLSGSLTEAWLSGGGKVIGTTEDAIYDRGIVGENLAANVGTVKSPNIEEILLLKPSFVILNPDIESHLELDSILTHAEIPHAYIRIDSFGDYLAFLENVCSATGRWDLFEKNGTGVKNEIESIVEKASNEGSNFGKKKVLLLRVYSTGIKVKATNIFAGTILADLGCVSILDNNFDLASDFSVEAVLLNNPEYIFVVPMGDTEAVVNNVDGAIINNEAWADIYAVRNNNVIILPKDLFHYTPNSRWAESYNYVARILYPELFT